MTSQPPPVGALAKDTSTGRVGRVMATADAPGSRGKWWLRPVDGGLEWDVDGEHVQALDDSGSPS